MPLVSQFEFTMKQCLRAQFDTRPTTLNVTLSAAWPGEPNRNPVMTGNNEPDPLTRSISVDVDPPATDGTIRCIREPIENVFVNISYYHNVSKAVTAKVTYEHLNRFTNTSRERVAEARAMVTHLMAARRAQLNACMTKRHPKAARAILRILVLDSSRLILEQVLLDGPDVPGDVWSQTHICVADALALARDGVPDGGAELFEVEVDLVRPTNPEPWRPSQLPAVPTDS